MTDEEPWPDRACSFERPRDTTANAMRWQAALDAALADQTLALGKEGKLTYRLYGSCPRCGHDTEQSVTFLVLRGLGRKPRDRFHSFNLDCSCDNQHEGRPKEQTGCGWGGPLRVRVLRPEGLDRG